MTKLKPYLLPAILAVAVAFVAVAAIKGCVGSVTPHGPRTLVVVRETSNIPEWLASLLVQVRLKDNAAWFKEHGGEPVYYDPDDPPAQQLPAPPSAGVLDTSGNVTASQTLTEGATVETLKQLVVKGGG
jgi:hypothetical protein